jgi:hypothetical protein
VELWERSSVSLPEKQWEWLHKTGSRLKAKRNYIIAHLIDFAMRDEEWFERFMKGAHYEAIEARDGKDT